MSDPDLATAISHDLGVALASEGRGRSVSGVELVSGGRSAVTAFAEVVAAGGRPERVVVRAVAHDATDLAVGSLRDQYELLELLRDEPVLAPRPLLLADGLPGTTHDLLVTTYVAGRVPQPWRRAGREEIATLRSSARFRDEFVAGLARIHDVSATRLPAGLSHEGDGSAREHSARARQRCASSFSNSGVFEDDPVLTYTLLWLEQHRPATTFGSGLVHGDYRLGNLVVDPSGGLCGVLDWELAEAGETLADLAWLCGPQGMVNGHAAGLFEPEELVAAYESVSGSSVPHDLFDHLRVEGTIRTAAVWAQLSVVELERGNPAVSLRCQESVLELIAMCAASVGLGPFPPVGATAAPLPSGLAVIAARLSGALAAEGRSLGAKQPPALRQTASFLDRLSSTMAGSEHEQYAADCTAVAPVGAGTASGLPGSVAPGAHLSGILRERHAAGLRLDDAGPEAADLRRLVEWSASPRIAFANLLSSTGARSVSR